MNALEKYAAKQVLIEKLAAWPAIARGVASVGRGVGRLIKSRKDARMVRRAHKAFLSKYPNPAKTPPGASEAFKKGYTQTTRALGNPISSGQAKRKAFLSSYKGPTGPGKTKTVSTARPREMPNRVPVTGLPRGLASSASRARAGRSKTHEMFTRAGPNSRIPPKQNYLHERVWKQGYGKSGPHSAGFASPFRGSKNAGRSAKRSAQKYLREAMGQRGKTSFRTSNVAKMK